MVEDPWDVNDEDWYDDEHDELDEGEVGRCPECGGEVYDFTDQCPACGRWLTADDRRAMWGEGAKSKGLRVTAVVVLVAFLVSLFAAGLAMF